MALQNFVDKVGPVVSAAWLNMVDILATTVFQNANNGASARTALFTDAPLEVANGGTGQRTAITAAQLGLYIPTLVKKPTTTVRTSTVTPANDPDLVFAISGAGTYTFSLICDVLQATTGNIGINANVNFSGTIDTSTPVYTMAGQSNTGGPPTAYNAFVSSLGTSQSAVQFSLTVLPNGFTSVLTANGYVICTTSGTLGFAWAQNTSSANGTTVGSASALLVTRIA